MATNRPPGATAPGVERTPAPVTRAAGSASCSRPPTASAISPRRQRRSRAVSCRDAARRARTSRSSNGCTTPAISWPFSWPLPRRPRCRPGRRGATAAAMASARSPTSTHLGAARGARRRASSSRADRRGVLGARVVVGHDDEVGEPARRGAHQRALALVAVARRRRARGSAARWSAGAARASTASTASGLWA